MKHKVIRYSMIILLIGLVALTAGRAYAQIDHTHPDLYKNIWINQGEIARVSLANLADKSVGSKDTVIARIQLLDTEGEVIAQSGEIRIEPDKIRSWSVHRNQIPAEGEPGTGRIYLQARIHITGRPADLNRNRAPLAPSFELIDPGTGRTLFATTAFFSTGILTVQGDAQGRGERIELESFSWGLVPGQTAHVGVANFAFVDGSVRSKDPIIVRIQLLDTEGEVIAQSDEIGIEQGKMRFWKAPREQIRLAGEPGTGRIQVRARIIASIHNDFATATFRFGRSPLAPMVEIIDASTGRTTPLYNPFITVDFLEELPDR